jgi:transcriptional regulator with XRE-family HTH domain
MTDTTNKPFPEAFADLRGRAGVTFRQLAARTRSVDPAGKGLSHGHLARLANGDERLHPHAMQLIAAAFEELDGPEYFVEYRMAQLRQAFDPNAADRHQALRRFLAWESLPAAQRERVLGAES